MEPKAHILLVEDEIDLRETVAEYLTLQGYEVTAVGEGTAMRRVLGQRAADLVVLDIQLPGRDGLTLARELRAGGGEMGIVMLTAAGATLDRIVGLEVGADDYLPKPFDLRELLARIRSVLRRVTARALARADSKAIRFDGLVLDLDGHRLLDREGREIPLTSMEFELLKALCLRPHRVLSRDQLLDLAHNRDIEAFDRSIDVRITRLRRKIEIDPAKPQIIRTVRGAGYLFAPEGAER